MFPEELALQTIVNSSTKPAHFHHIWHLPCPSKLQLFLFLQRIKVSFVPYLGPCSYPSQLCNFSRQCSFCLRGPSLPLSVSGSRPWFSLALLPNSSSSSPLSSDAQERACMHQSYLTQKWIWMNIKIKFKYGI